MLLWSAQGSTTVADPEGIDVKHKMVRAAFVAVFSLVAVATSASAAVARDTSWGCGGFC